MYKRYIVFCLQKYYPCGGMKDANESFEDLEPAVAYANAWLDGDKQPSAGRRNSVHILDCQLRDKIWERCPHD